MVIGNGMIAKEFSSYRSDDDHIIFASGVSDSTHSTALSFEREKLLLLDTIRNNPGKKLVYFSTCSIYDPSMKNAAYVRHKISMEELIKEEHAPYTIFRLSNPVGRTGNTNTVFNFFISNIHSGHHFEVWKNASRNIIDIDDMYIICNEILQHEMFSGETVNIANPANYPVPYIIDTIEAHFHKKGKYTMLDKGDGPHIDISAIAPLIKKFNINFDGAYLPGLLQKYFPV
jgi:UDP-2-acetamido-2,6-beta-L-arabino-hexul-4-ose reductase